MKASYLDGRYVTIDGIEYQYFYGTSYLGLPYDLDFNRLIQEGQHKYGSSLGSSPLSTPQLDVYDNLENVLASTYGFEDALLFASGYSAGQTLVNIFHNSNSKIEYGDVAHPALKLDSVSAQVPENTHSEIKVYTGDYIDPISLEKYNVDLQSTEIDKILLDVSHGLGVFDTDIITLSKHEKLILVGSLNKALGINAGIILCSSSLKHELKTSDRYKTASAPSPSECYALQRAIETGLVNKKKEDLNRLIKTLVPQKNIHTIPDFPVLTFDNYSEDLYNHFREQRVLIWRNRYPLSESEMVNRAVITAAHIEADVEQLMTKFQMHIKSSL